MNRAPRGRRRRPPCCGNAAAHAESTARASRQPSPRFLRPSETNEKGRARHHVQARPLPGGQQPRKPPRHTQTRRFPLGNADGVRSWRTTELFGAGVLCQVKLTIIFADPSGAGWLEGETRGGRQLAMPSPQACCGDSPSWRRGPRRGVGGAAMVWQLDSWASAIQPIALLAASSRSRRTAASRLMAPRSPSRRCRTETARLCCSRPPQTNM